MLLARTAVRLDRLQPVSKTRAGSRGLGREREGNDESSKRLNRLLKCQICVHRQPVSRFSYFRVRFPCATATSADARKSARAAFAAARSARRPQRPGEQLLGATHEVDPGGGAEPAMAFVGVLHVLELDPGLGRGIAEAPAMLERHPLVVVLAHAASTGTLMSAARNTGEVRWSFSASFSGSPSSVRR